MYLIKYKFYNKLTCTSTYKNSTPRSKYYILNKPIVTHSPILIMGYLFQPYHIFKYKSLTIYF